MTRRKRIIEPQRRRGAEAQNEELSPRLCVSAVILAVALAMVLVGCGSKEPAGKEPVVTVQAAAVKRGPIQRVVSSEAVLYPLKQTAIVPKISAPVSEFYVNRGDVVHRGELLAKLESKDLAAAVVENRGAYEQAQAAYQTATQASVPEEVQKAELDVKGAKDALNAAQKRYDSLQALYKQGAAARKDVNDAGVVLTQDQNTYDIANRHLETLKLVREDNLKSAQGQLTQAQGRYDAAQAQLGYSDIRSPIDGVVADRPLYPGEMAAAGTPLITLMNVSKVIARAHIPQSEAQLLKAGDAARLAVAGASEQVSGKVTIVSPALDPGSTTVEVWAEFQNPNRSLKPGTTAQVSMVAETVPNALIVPASALLTAPDGSTTVMVAGSDDKAHQRAVKAGIRQGDDVQITEGLKEGERVVTAGAYGLADNTSIKIESAPQSEAKD